MLTANEMVVEETRQLRQAIRNLAACHAWWLDFSESQRAEIATAFCLQRPLTKGGIEWCYKHRKQFPHIVPAQSVIVLTERSA